MQPMTRTLRLREEHEALGARLVVEDGIERVEGYGPRDDEYRHLVDAVGVADLSCRALLRVVGPEAASYLHGMVTNEVNGLRPGQGNLATIVHARGRMLGDCRVFRLSEEEIWVDVPARARESILAHLDQHLISEDCELSDQADAWQGFGAWGPRARDAVRDALGVEPTELSPNANRWLDAPGGRVLVVGSVLFGVPGLELWCETGRAAELWRALVEAARRAGGGPVGEAALETARVLRGVPRWGRELGEDTIPLEANLREAISYTKGCYIGQEVIAKATYRGAVRRRLVRLEVSAGARPGDSLLEEGLVVGELTSVVDPDPEGGEPKALGYVKRDRAEAGREFSVSSGGRARVIWAPEDPA